LGTLMTFLIGAIIIGSGLFLLARALKREAVDGACASCYHKDGCSSCSTIVQMKRSDDQ
jgi:hypothetical protein